MINESITPKLNFFFKWKPISINYYIDTSYEEKAKSTSIIWRNRFGKIIVKHYYGLVITKEILNETK